MNTKSANVSTVPIICFDPVHGKKPHGERKKQTHLQNMLPLLYFSLFLSEIYTSETSFPPDISLKINEQKSKIGEGAFRIWN